MLLWSQHISNIKHASSELQILCLHPFSQYSRKHVGRHANVLIFVLFSVLQIYYQSSMHIQSHI